MKRLSCSTLAAIALTATLAFSPATGQTGAYISKVEGTYAPGKVAPGSTLRLYIAVRNDTTEVIGGLTLGFEVSESGGASWDTLTSHWATNFDPRVFSLLYALRIYGDALSPDTLAIEGAIFATGGLPPGFDDDIAVVEIGPIDGPLGATITFDSVGVYGPGVIPWQMNLWNGSPIPELSFAGMTFEIDECCTGKVGNVNADPLDAVNLTDLTLMVNNVFINFGEFPCPKEANTSLDPEGRITLTDVTLLMNHLFITFQPLGDCP